MVHAVEVNNIDKTFGDHKALKSVDLTVEQGEMIALIGSSGSGKSTLLRLVAGLLVADRTKSADESFILVNGCPMQAAGKLSAQVRKNRCCIAFIFQQFNLVRRLSVLTNVLLGLLGEIPRWRGTLGYFTAEEKARALKALERVGLAEFAYQRASALSGGQQQRVAIARALLQDADVIVADEPIASLDPRSARKVMDILADINQQDGKTVVVSLHQVDYATNYCRRIVGLANGEVCLDKSANELQSADLTELYGDDNDEIDYGAPVVEPRVASIAPAASVAVSA